MNLEALKNYLVCILQAESFYGIKTWYEVELWKKIQTQNIWQRGSGSNFNSNNLLFLDLVENFDEASKNEANWTVTSWIKLKLEKATWSCYFILWLPWFYFLMRSQDLWYLETCWICSSLVTACTQYYFCGPIEQTYALK